MLYIPPTKQTGFPGGSVIMNPPANTRETGLIPGLGRSPGEGNHLENNNPLQYSCLGNATGREAWSQKEFIRSQKELDKFIRSQKELDKTG